MEFDFPSTKIEFDFEPQGTLKTLKLSLEIMHLSVCCTLFKSIAKYFLRFSALKAMLLLFSFHFSLVFFVLFETCCCHCEWHRSVNEKTGQRTEIKVYSQRIHVNCLGVLTYRLRRNILRSMLSPLYCC